jgi:outer membrane immunogenic protein
MRRSTIAAIAAVSTIALTQIASAADLPRKAPEYAPPPPPPYSWTGFYIGGNAGFSGGKAGTDFSVAPVIVDTNIGSVIVPGAVASESPHLNGLIGGGQIGYNWQFSSNWVVGLEADIQASGEKGGRGFGIPFDFFFVPPGPGVVIQERVRGSATADYEAKISWFGTVRGRIGYAWDRVMVYATGGLAYGEVKLQGTSTVSGIIGNVLPPIPSPGPAFSIAHAVGHSQVNTGWTVGVGAEVALGGNWTGKFDYLYIDLGSLNDPDDGLVIVNSVSGGQTFTHTKYTDNIFRVGLNYKFY